MKIAISGASGFIGTNLTHYYMMRGYRVIALDRTFFTDEADNKLMSALAEADVVINLAGASINHRWSKSYKKKLYNSRILTTRKIVQTINSLELKPQLFISASAVGYYPVEGCHDEYSAVQGDDFLAKLCEEWEHEAKNVSSDVRIAITRFGVVLARKGGAFEKMTLPMMFKIGTVIGPGTQLVPWISINDLMKGMEHIINNPLINGVVNFVSPERITNKELMKATAMKKKCLFTITIPQLFFKLALGEASGFITKGQCVIPQKLLDSGFMFETPHINKFLNALINRY